MRRSLALLGSALALFGCDPDDPPPASRARIEPMRVAADVVVGTVVDEGLEPLDGGRVAIGCRGADADAVVAAIADDGNFRVAGVDPRCAVLEVTVDHATHVGSAILDRDRVATIEARPRPRVRGVVVDSNGRPLVAARVSTLEPPATTTTDADGWFSLPGVAGATLVAGAPGFRFTSAPIDPRALVAAEELELELEPGERLRVRLVDRTGSPVRDGTRVLARAIERPWDLHAAVTAGGSARFSDLGPGSYRLRALDEHRDLGVDVLARAGADVVVVAPKPP